jgi:site-specific recombinase XerD
MQIRIYLTESLKGEPPIWVSCFINKVKLRAHTSKYARIFDNKCTFDKKKQRIKGDVIGAKEVNQYLSDLESGITAYMTPYVDTAFAPSQDEFKAFVSEFADQYKTAAQTAMVRSKALDASQRGIIDLNSSNLTLIDDGSGNMVAPPTSFLKYMEARIDFELKEKKISEKHYNNVWHGLNQLIAFNEIYPFSFHNMDHDFYSSFVVFLAGQGLLTNTIGTYLGHMKRYAKLAHKEKYIKNLEWQTFKVIRERVKKISFGESDLLKVYSIKDYPSQRIREAVDLSVFRFYAGGIRHGDSQRLRRENVLKVRMGNGKFANVLSFAQNKTQEHNAVVLNSIAMEILEKYNYSLPKFSTPTKCNDQMKLAFKHAGYTEQILVIRHSNKVKVEVLKEAWMLYGRTHTVRYAAVKFIVQNKGTLYLAKSVVGHTSVKTTEGYMDMDEQYKHEEYLKLTEGAADRLKEIEKQEEVLLQERQEAKVLEETYGRV